MKGITMSYNTTIYEDIKLIGSLVADTAQAQELLVLFDEKKLHVEVKERQLEQAEEMKQEYLSGAGSGKNIIRQIDAKSQNGRN